MTPPTVLVLVRFRSRLSYDEVLRVVDERAPEFAALQGLQQKYYLHDPASGEFAGVYLWTSREAQVAYQASALRASIAEAYATEGAPRVEIYDVVKSLRT